MTEDGTEIEVPQEKLNPGIKEEHGRWRCTTQDRKFKDLLSD